MLTPILELNAYETDYLYDEIFVRESYLQHGIRLEPGAVVFDVGANIGLFTMFVKQRCPDARVRAFEPIPEAFECLAHNTARYGDSVDVAMLALSDKDGRSSFVYYPGYSVISGFHADAEKDSAVIKAGMRNGLRASGGAIDEAGIDKLVDGRMRERREIRCRTKSIARIIAETGESRVDLLKIDAERSESAILQGIDAADWPKIGQIVMEIHETTEATAICSAIEEKGFEVVLEREPALAESGIHNLYAIRKGGLK